MKYSHAFSMHRCTMIQDKKLGHSFFCTACVPGFTAHCTVWPVSRGISSVNYILSNATFSEKKMGYQPIVLFQPQTQFSWANPGLEDMQQDLFLPSFSEAQCTSFRRSLFDFCRSQKTTSTTTRIILEDTVMVPNIRYNSEPPLEGAI